jgi:hypothetical protein
MFSRRQDSAVEAALLTALSDAVSGAIFVRRAFAITTAAPAAGLPTLRGPEDAGRFLEKKQHNPAAAAHVLAQDDETLFAALDAAAAKDYKTLTCWGLDAWLLPYTELQRLMLSMLHCGELDLLRRFRISPTAFAAFLVDVAAHYNGASCDGCLLLFSRHWQDLADMHSPPQITLSVRCLFPFYRADDLLC